MKLQVDLFRGQKITSIEGYEQNSDRVIFNFENGARIIFAHEPECCESVFLADLDENIQVGERLMFLEVRTQCLEPNEDHEGMTWTFITILTDKCHETMRWVGESNGWYSEKPTIIFIDKDGFFVDENGNPDFPYDY